MKKNGFTLVELLAVIVIMALLLTVAVPAVIGVSTKIRNNMYCSKIDDIESAAKIYGENYKDLIEEKADKKITIHVYSLIENNLYNKESKDCDGVGHNGFANKTSVCVLDPRNGRSLDQEEIELSIKDKRVAAKFKNRDSVCNK